MSIRINSPPPDLIAAVFGLPMPPASSDAEQHSETGTAQGSLAVPSYATSSAGVWLADICDILCGNQLPYSDGDEPPAVQAGSRSPARQEDPGNLGQDKAKASMAAVAGEAEAGARRDGKQLKKEIKGEKRASAAAQPGQQKRQKKAAGHLARPTKKSSAAAAKAAVQQAQQDAAEPVAKPPQMSLKEKMLLASRAQRERPAAALATSAEEDRTAADDQRRDEAVPRVSAAIGHLMVDTAHGAVGADASHDSAAGLPEAETAAVVLDSDGDSEEGLSQKPLLQRLQGRLRLAQRDAVTVANHQPQWTSVGATDAPAQHCAEVEVEVQREGTLSQVPLAERAGSRAAQSRPRSQHALGTVVPAEESHPGQDQMAAHAVEAELEVCEVLDIDGEADVEAVGLSQLPLACRVPQVWRETVAQKVAAASALGLTATDGPAQGTGLNGGPDIERARETARSDGRSSAHRADADGAAALSHRCSAQQSGLKQRAADAARKPLRPDSTPDLAAQCQLPVPSETDRHPPQPSASADRAEPADAAGRQQSAQKPQPGSAGQRTSIVGNWDLLDDLGGLDLLLPPQSPVLEAALETPCAAGNTAPAGASAEEPSSSPLVAAGRRHGPAPRHRNVLWSPEEATPLAGACNQPAEGSRPTDPSDSTGCFRRPVARRKRAIIDSCTPGDTVTSVSLLLHAFPASQG